MIQPPTVSILVIHQQSHSPVHSFCSYLQSIKHLTVNIKESLPKDLSTYDIVVTTDAASLADQEKKLEQFVLDGGGWLCLVNLSEYPLPKMLGTRATTVCSSSEVRVLFQDKNNPLADRLPDAFYSAGKFQGLEIIEDDTEIILYADWHYTHKPVLVKRPAGEWFCCLYNPAGL